MPTKTWAAGEDFNAVDINSYLQKQMVLSFANATERAEEISVPTVGMVTYLASTGGFEVFTDKTTPPSWRPPWNTAWGLIYNSVVADIALVVSPAWIVRQLPIPLAGRWYKVEFDFTYQTANMGYTEVRFQTESALDIQTLQTLYATWARRVPLWHVYQGGPNASIGVIGNAWADAVTSNTSWCRVKVLDIGPV